MRRKAAILALALMPMAIQAKCAEQTYLLEGQVEDGSGRPAVGALVGASWLEGGQPAGPAIAVTDRAGRYRLSVRFRPNDDMPTHGQACTDRLGRVGVVAYLSGQRSPLQIGVSNVRQTLSKIKIDEALAP
ncbi:carboxypeptidase-like regulatory domain-containing protein [Roseateles chitinivorans]|uniref:carboxypeptidase-like regulatory domain-containing protein n=1 Tax=Roseateles chitinivorans TaxID=2917965 RepID=UPI003D670362